jgi:hypothetical protein
MTIDLLQGKDVSKAGAETMIEMNVMEYFNTESIFDVGFLTGGEEDGVTKDMSKDTLISSDYQIYIGDSESKNNTSFKIKFGNAGLVEIYVRRPVNLVQGLAKIGGFLGFLKIFSLLLSVLHEILFERNLSKASKPSPLSENLSEAAQNTSDEEDSQIVRNADNIQSMADERVDTK